MSRSIHTPREEIEENLVTMNYLLLEFNEAERISDAVYHLTTDSYVSMFLWKFLNAQDEVGLKLTKTTDSDVPTVPVNFNGIKYKVTEENCNRKLPLLQLDGCHNIIGLCSVLRGICRIMKTTKSDELASRLLGYKENCLLAPSEVSSWTNFCEREMIDCAERLQMASGEIQFPLEMMKFETDLANPTRVHNIYKLAREANKDQSIKSGSEIFIEHKFCHGNEMSLADVVLYAIYKLIFTSVVDAEEAEKVVPLTFRWLKSMENENLDETFDSLRDGTPCQRKMPLKFLDEIPKVNEDGKYFSLYKREATGFRSKTIKARKVFNSQSELDAVMEKLKALNIEAKSLPGDSNQESINDDYVRELLECGELPAQRLDKKKSQLKSLANEVLKIAQPNDVIVDFCSGTGHLGFLVAQLLPQCRIVILETKEESIRRAKVKAELLKLRNVTFYQCNLVSIDRRKLTTCN